MTLLTVSLNKFRTVETHADLLFVAAGFLPTSGNGATSAIEDAVTIAECLKNGGREKVAEAVKIHTLLRSDRVACAQLLGFVNAQRLHKNTSQVGGDRSKVQQKVPKW